MRINIALILAALTVTCSLVSAQVNRCVGADGKVVYSDTACPNSSREARTVQGVKPGYTPPAPKSERITFTGAHRTDYIKASALMDNIRILGRDCEWALKVDKSQVSICITFISKLGPGGQFSQITDHVSELNKDRAAAGQNIDELHALMRHMEAVVRYKEFALANLGVTSSR